MKKLFLALTVLVGLCMYSLDCNAQFWGKTSKMPCNFSCDKNYFGATGTATGLPEDLPDLLIEANENVENLVVARMGKMINKASQQITETIRSYGGKKKSLADNQAVIETKIHDLLASVDADCTEIGDPDKKTGRIYVFVGYKIPKKSIEEAVEKGLNEITSGEAKDIRNRAKDIKAEFAESLKNVVDDNNSEEKSDDDE